MSQFFNQVAKVLVFQLQHQSFQWISGLISFRIDWFDLLSSQSALKSLLRVEKHKFEPQYIVVAVIQSLWRVGLFAITWTEACQAPLSSTISQSLLKFMSIESVILSNHLILCCPLLLPSIFPSIRVFSSELVVCIRWPNYWSFGFSISPWPR